MQKTPLKSILILAISAALVAGTLPPTYSVSHLSDSETGSGLFVAGELDLQVNGNNPHAGPLITLEVDSTDCDDENGDGGCHTCCHDDEEQDCCRTYCEEVLLHLTENSNPAHAWICFEKVQAASPDENGEAGVVHAYGEEETEGSIEVERSDGTTVTYTYEAKQACIKFEDGEPQLGEDDTIGLTDTFVVTMHGGCLPVSGHLKWGEAADPSWQPFTLTAVGETVDIYHDSTLTYTITLVEKTGGTYTFNATSIAKPGATALSHIEFCFIECGNGCLNDYVDIDLSVTDPETGATHMLLSLDDHKNLSWLDGQCIPLTTPGGISALQPCTSYVVNVSMHVCGTADEIAGRGVEFDLVFHVEQARNGGAGLSDTETSMGNTIIAGGGGP